jgi:hypothetical protein
MKGMTYERYWKHRANPAERNGEGPEPMGGCFDKDKEAIPKYKTNAKR